MKSKMIAVTIILLLLLIVISGILFLPLTLVANTENKKFFISLPGVLKVSIPGSFSDGIKIRLLFFSFKINPLEQKKTGNDSSKPKKKKNRKSRIKKPIELFQKILRTFKVKKFDADIDTGDFPINAQLVPVALMLSNNKRNIHINFENRNSLDIHIITRIGNIMYTYIKHKINTN